METKTGKRCPEYSQCRSGWERRACKALTARGIPHRHQSRKYPVILRGGEQVTYTPDIEVDGLIIEPHFDMDPSFLDKMAAFKEQYPEKRVVLITLNDALPDVPDGIFAEKLPIEYCGAAPLGDLLVPTLRRMAKSGMECVA